MNASSPGRLLPWALVTPALAWTLVFFVLPFIAMAVLSLLEHGGAEFRGQPRHFSLLPVHPYLDVVRSGRHDLIDFGTSGLRSPDRGARNRQR